MDFKKVPLSHSIGIELLKKIFGVYCIAAILISMTQAWIEYIQSRDRIIQSMVEQQYLVEEGLATAVWHLDKPLLGSLIDGILSHSNVTSIHVYDEYGKMMAHTGDDSIFGGPDHDLTDTIKPGVDTNKLITLLDNEQAYFHAFDLADPTHISNGVIGRVIFSTDRGVVIEDIKPTLVSLVAAAFIKTLLLWLVFIYFGRNLLSRPLGNVIAAIRNMPVDKTGRGKAVIDDRKLNEIDLIKYALSNLKERLVGTLSELHASNAKLNNINIHLQRAVEQSPTISMILSAEGELIYVTPSFTELTGCPAEDIQLVLENILEGCSFNEVTRQFEKERFEGVLWQGEIKLKDRQEAPLYLAVNLSPVHCDEGVVDNYLISATDISSLKQLEFSLKKKNSQQLKIISKLEETQAQLVQAEKMASIGQLAAGVAHEINNPVGFINSNLTTLVDYLNGLFGLIEQYRVEVIQLDASLVGVDHYKQKIDFDYIKDDVPLMLDETREGLERVKKIVRDLMDFSRVSETDFEKYDLRKGLESTLNVAWHELKYKVKIIRDFDDIPEVECMPSQINQVFMNLMVNAGQAIDSEGVIILRARQLDGRVVIEVEDNGSGIDEKHQDKLFDPFFTTKPIGVGTGLGLSVSYGIIKNHGGSISVNSSVGKGTCFTISLPVSQQR